MNSSDLLEAATGGASIEHLLVLFMLLTSVVLVAIALERAFALYRVRTSVAQAPRAVGIARDEGLAAARAALTSGPAATVLAAGLDRELGAIKGDALMAMAREQKRLAGSMRARTWVLATAGALMPFVGLFGTVLGVMASFQAIGESGQGGFAVVSVGISQALIATAVGIAVALEGVVLFNVLQSAVQRLGRDLSLAVDELAEIIVVTRRSDAGDP